ncbi:hypothetical protein [Prevotella sp.]|nr:hypothetical protein [Prevotella sp.]
MKKYFMKDSGEELKFGDMIELDFTKDTSDGHTCHHHLECKFIPGLIPMLLEQGIIEEKEFENKNNDTPDDNCLETAQMIMSTLEIIANKVKQMDDKITDLNKIVKKLQHNATKSA